MQLALDIDPTPADELDRQADRIERNVILPARARGLVAVEDIGSREAARLRAQAELKRKDR